MNSRIRLSRGAVILAASIMAANGTFAEDDIEQVTVVGQRAMMQNAIEQQRNSDQIKSVLTRDAIGQFPDQNVAEAVRRLTGVNVLNDQGEGRFIAIRGLDPSLNSASINGTRVPSPESDTRSVALDVVASELIESIEIIKTLTPDMDADTIGAAIRINTVSAFNAEKPSLNVKAEGSYNDLNEETSPKLAADFIYPLSERLGVSGGFSYHDRDTSTDNIESEGWAIENGILYADAIEYRDYDVNRERIGGNLSFDFRASDNTNLYARTLFSRFDDTEERRRLVIEMDEAPNSGNLTSATFLSDDGEIAIDRGLKDRFESQQIYSFQFGGETQTDTWLFEYELAYSHAEEEETDTEDPTRFSTDFDGAGDLAITFNYADMENPTFDVTTGVTDFNDPANYGFDKLETVQGDAEDDELAMKLDVSRDFQLSSGADLNLKFGGKYRQRTKEFDLSLSVFDDFNGSYDLSDVAGRQSYDLFPLGALPDLGRVRDFNDANRSSFVLNQVETDFESAIEDFKVDEDVTAAYIMGRYEQGPLMIVGGARVERTENNIEASLVELVEEDGTRNGVVLAQDTVFVTANRFDKDYTDWMPSIGMRYELSEDILLRAGVFKSIVRPNIAALPPRFIVEEADDGEREGEFGNPDLDPFEAWNFDASVEYYLAPSAVLQAGIFFKNIENFIVEREFDAGDAPFNGVYNGVAFDEAVIPLNGDEADVFGLELNYQHALTHLPSPFDGLLVGLNYTYTDSEGDIGARSIPLPAASENNYNAMLGYEKGPLSVRLTAAYRDEYLDELGGSPDEDRYVEDHLQWDLTAKYRMTENVQVYAQMVNLTDEPYVAFQPGPGANRLLQYEEYSWTANFGIQANF